MEKQVYFHEVNSHWLNSFTSSIGTLRLMSTSQLLLKCVSIMVYSKGEGLVSGSLQTILLQNSIIRDGRGVTHVKL